MDVDEDDDFYAPEENVQEETGLPAKSDETPEIKNQVNDQDEDLEEGEEEDEGEEDSDSV
jgi:hypothetical protein